MIPSIIFPLLHLISFAFFMKQQNAMVTTRINSLQMTFRCGQQWHMGQWSSMRLEIQDAMHQWPKANV